jgi:aspartate 1-decarboxylase
MKGLFNPVDTVSRQFKNGLMGTGVLGYDEINMSQSIKQFTTGSRTGTITVDGTMSAQGSSKITLNGTTGNTLAVGDVFTIANVFAVNPQTRESTGSLQQFVVTAANTAAASKFTDVSISPAIYTASHALATVNSFPQNLAAVTFVGSASTQYPQNLVYHKDAITMATADLIMPQGVDMASRQVHNGISMRIVRQYDINNDRMPCRIDVLYGYSVIRPQMAVRLWG